MELVGAHTYKVIAEIPLQALHLPSWPFIFVPHTFNTCAGLRPYLRREFWLLSFILTLLAGVGGNILYTLFTHGHPFFLSKSVVLPTIALIWWLVNHSPYDIIWRMYHWPPVRYLLQIVAALNRCRSVCVGFDKGREMFPTEPAALFSIAFLAGLSGGLVTVWVKKLVLRPSDQPVHSEFSKPTWVIGSVLLASVWLYCVEELHLLPIPVRLSCAT